MRKLTPLQLAVLEEAAEHIFTSPPLAAYEVDRHWKALEPVFARLLLRGLLSGTMYDARITAAGRAAVADMHRRMLDEAE